MLFSFFFLGSLAYYKYQAKEPTIMDKTSALGLVLPSINTNTLDDVQADYQKVSSREMEIKDMKKRFLIFLPWFIFIPLILLVTSIHEYGHYIMCRRAGVHVNRYGLACVSIFSIPLPLFAGFVEPAKTYMDKTSKFNFFSIISAGVSLNVLLGIILLIIPYSYFSYLGFIFNLGVGMINVLPLGFLDGGQFIGRISSKLNWVTSIVSALLLALLL
jgi:membrane-associated protease RseP (regulator of RpoE activity)